MFPGGGFLSVGVFILFLVTFERINGGQIVRSEVVAYIELQIWG